MLLCRLYIPPRTPSAFHPYFLSSSPSLPFINIHHTLPLTFLTPDTLLFSYYNVKVLPEDFEGDVIIAKGDSFKNIVINNSKDVFVEFYAPW